ncbi:EF-hand domain-containing protein [Sphingobium sp. CR2-8]|uniref:EF-hand domain-containing protein n=1 Tax=Sphingobium sp. CR2-8 TaxID=1306534 RepID=UPI002DB78CD0|nr:EF-hand domain-containing protein [Sphingobium sp. CR2-8]MEC3911576.1 EF-hand domain-containing protein [Sphingobium sp. CR2-8]
MIRTFLFSTAIAVAAPAMAQTMAPDQGTVPAAPQSATPAAPTAPQSATPATPANPATSVATIVDSEFPAYDANSDGQLDQPEFTRWMVALKGQEMKATGSTLPAEQVTAWANGAFATADKDKSTSISKPELVSYLSGGAG